jgi:replication-associated recombination protein RarA
MDRFIFPQALKKELQFIISNPNKLGGILCLYGSYGIGKTSFATFLGNLLANEVIHYDCAKTKSLILEDIECRNRTISLASLWDTDLQTEKVFERCYILDEFHSLTKRNKDSFKIPLEKLTEDNRCLIIIIVNTDTKSSLINKALTPAIASRCYSINFDIKTDEYEDIFLQIKEKYPILSESFIEQTLPDLRQIFKKVRLLSD